MSLEYNGSNGVWWFRRLLVYQYHFFILWICQQRAGRPRKYDGLANKWIYLSPLHWRNWKFLRVQTAWMAMICHTLPYLHFQHYCLSLLSLDCRHCFFISCAIYRNYNIHCHYIINLNGFINNSELPLLIFVGAVKIFNSILSVNQ